MSSFRDRFRTAQTLRKGCRHEERVRHALLSTGSEAVWQRIEGCGVGRLCNSAYCKACRERNVQTHSRRLVQLHREHHGHDEAAARANLRFVTALCELVPLDEGGIREAIGRAKRALTSIRRSFPGLLIEGRFETEVIDVEGVFASLCPRKATVIRSLMGDDPDRLPGQDMALVHFHAIVFLNGHDPREVREKFAGKWSGNYRIKLDKLHHDKSTDYNIRKLCGYFLKSRVRYNLRMETLSFIDGDYIGDDSLSSLVTSDVSIGINQMLIYSKGKCR